ncbi:hypothetical protein QDX25_10040 [Auritidibacter ignavus]|uniref:hypothetical protein n=1 Tax=Auritidibacter TaxID=1160973 RepID=UPI000D729E87|nr:MULTISPECIES: hypothetical protein [Auritidibacter]PXA77368.1 hypothetical protein DCC26_08375 [Auritidibacter sp. NML120779]PXA80595.1 hypothetical protein DCC25_05050 [Auritidibacter sp. NML120636]WGH81115.1 hypothetical protein QDX25_10040 [Auritidibacter ignavus]WGH85704.1 hypothetical protein QDX24_09005 [Auritidibacter ignavus]WGH87991.1 hypothetical protein QDX22_09010 [Auritidibacter ignavus]
MSENNELDQDIETRLERVLADTETSMAELREELTRIQTERRQHQEVDRLEEHLANATVRWSKIKEFLQLMVAELRGAQIHAEDASAESAEQASGQQDSGEEKN